MFDGSGSNNDEISSDPIFPDPKFESTKTPNDSKLSEKILSFSIQLSSSDLKGDKLIKYNATDHTDKAPEGYFTANDLLRNQDYIYSSALKTIYERCSKGEELTPQEKDSFQTTLEEELIKITQITSFRDSYSLTSKDLGFNVDNIEEVKKNFDKIADKISSKDQQPANSLCDVVSETYRLIKEGKSKDVIKSTLDSKLEEVKTRDAKNTIETDFHRLPLTVIDDSGEKVFRDYPEFTQWAREKKLSEEQIGLITTMHNQTTFFNVDLPILKNLLSDESHMPSSNSSERRITLDIRDDKVTYRSNGYFGIMGITGEGPKMLDSAFLSSTEADITELKGNKFTPGISSSEVNWTRNIMLIGDSNLITPKFPGPLKEMIPIQKSKQIEFFCNAFVRVRNEILEPIIHDNPKLLNKPEFIERFKLSNEEIENYSIDIISEARIKAASIRKSQQNTQEVSSSFFGAKKSKNQGRYP